MSEQNENLKMSELIADIKKAGAAELVVEFEYPYVPGVFISLAHASKQMLRRLGDEAKEQFFNTRTRQPEERMNSEKFDKATSREIIKGWRGLTVAGLRKIIPGLTTNAAPDTEVPYGEELAFILADNSMDFQIWVVNTAMSVENFAKVAEKKKEQYENLA